ncbi:MAG TPA: A/G-specific adenine glycosylase [Thermoanaerobaculia bacterium]|nr:A/G-specific adenine glycosylase [Thermoanaerobaculia bacterium]
MSAGAALLAWFDRHRRDLPWRRDQDPYRVWVSEIMLQQTRVEAAIPYFERFVSRFPSVEALAGAHQAEVLAAWAGLGYYRRARQLHAAAELVVEQGGFPRTTASLKALPGVGEYTAAAIASIAFGVAEPVLDGNVERVLSRWLASGSDPRQRAVRRTLREAAAGLLDASRPGDSNQALMELGAMVCVPQRPRCLLCPLAETCRGRAGGNPEAFPAPRIKPRPVKVRWLLALVEEGGRLLLVRRDDASELLAGTWELPWIELDAAPLETPSAAATALGRAYGSSWSLLEELGTVRHGITIRAITATVCRARIEAAGEVHQGIEAGWFYREEIARLPRSALLGKALRLVEARAEPPGAPGRRPRAGTSR